MKVAFSVGASSTKVIQALEKMADDVEYYTYKSVGEMVKESMMRKVFFDRIIFSELILGKDIENDLRTLDEYVRECSENANVVLICQDKDSEAERVFNEVFNSPMYTPVVIPRATPKLLLEVVTHDIIEIKSKYYTLEERKMAKTVTSKYAREEGSPEIKVEEKKPEKKGFLKSLFGKKEHEPETQKETLSNENATSDVSNIGVGLGNAVLESAIESGATVVGSVGVATTIGSVSESNVDGSSGFGDSVPVSNEVSDFDGEINNDLGDLGLGELGSMHADTGFLDEDDLNSLLEESEDKEELKEELEEEPEYSQKLEDQEEDEEESSLRQKINELKHEKALSSGKIRVVTGEHGTGVTSYIAESAMNLANKGKRVLIIDLDDKYHGILSYLDIDEYYAKGAYNGLDKNRVYSEDGLDIMSPGYGYQVQKGSLYAVINTSVLDDYDVVFIDCPLENLSNISEEDMLKLAVMIRVKGNKGSILNTISLLTDRSSISSELEDRLYSNSKIVVIDKIEEYKEDLEYSKHLCVFGRGNWFEKITG